MHLALHYIANKLWFWVSLFQNPVLKRGGEAVIFVILHQEAGQVRTNSKYEINYPFQIIKFNRQSLNRLGKNKFS